MLTHSKREVERGGDVEACRDITLFFALMLACVDTRSSSYLVVRVCVCV